MICTAYDEFCRELEDDRGQALWVARLSDGLTVYQDDGRPGTEGPAWHRLRRYCQLEYVGVVELWLKFRDHVEKDFLPTNAPSYYFSRAIMADMAGRTSHFYNLGAGKEGGVVVTRWHVPELIHVGTEVREVVPADCLLTNPGRPLQ